ncbi:hypothetical protein CLV52_1907 [Amnibacterium kyonggiense]|uniref:Uncharacterized protein n=2 Tax=Amnibacterium kyonggiense TaxID=595671 RepID=A0A4R7FKT9_9MICO|nr:hypothetical protein CLV52_1907 [Amnibacterium kyonggiense]
MYSPAAERERRRTRRVRLVVIGALAVVFVGAALLWPRPTPGALTVATGERVAPAGVLQGELSADRSGEQVCYSVATSTGTAVLRFVPGWSADERLGLRDAAGGVVAQPGDVVRVLGDPGPVGSVAGCAERGRTWTVTSVQIRS